MCLCFQPIVTPAEVGIDATQTQIDEERAVCLYVRALSDERVEASRCFETLSPFPPPPPPMPRTIASAIETRLRRKRVRMNCAPEMDRRLASAVQRGLKLPSDIISPASLESGGEQEVPPPLPNKLPRLSLSPLLNEEEFL